MTHLPAGWTEVALGELMPKRRRSIDPRKFPDEEFSLLSIPAFDAGSPERVLGSVVGSTKQLVEPGDVLLAKIVPHIRRAWIVPHCDLRTIGSSEWIVFRDRSVDPGYLRHLLVSDRFHRSFMQTVAGVGGSLLRARPAHVANIRVPLPPLEEQRRIAAILDKADELRAKRRAALDKLDSLTQSIFLDMFGGPDWPSRWPTAKLKELCVVSGEYGAAVPSVPFDPNLPRYVRITDIDEAGQLSSDPVSPGGSAAEWSRFRLCPGDLLFARSGATVGKCYLHRSSKDEHVFAGYLIRFRPDPSVLDPEFAFGFTRSTSYQAWVKTQQRAVAQPNINAKQYGDLILPVPPLEEQRRYAQFCATVAERRRLMLGSAHRLELLSTSLQSRAFQGAL